MIRGNRLNRIHLIFHRSKVNQHQLFILFAANDIGGLDVAVNDLVPMNILDHGQNFAEELLYPGLAKGASPLYFLLQG